MTEPTVRALTSLRSFLLTSTRVSIGLGILAIVLVLSGTLALAAPNPARDDAYETAVDTELTVDAPGVLGNDRGGNLTATEVSPPSHGSLNFEADGSFTYTPDPGFAGTDAFEYEAANASGSQSGQATVTIDVLAAETAPTANDQSVSTDEDTSHLITLDGDDADGDPLTFTIESLPSDGVLYDGDRTSPDRFRIKSNKLPYTLGGSGDEVTYVPDAGFNGDDSFTFSVSDGTLDSAPATVDITVASGNEAPMAVDDTATVDENSADNTIDVLANDTDVDGDTLTVSDVTQPADGTVAIATDSLSVTYTPDADFFGTDTFTYDVSDGTLTDTATVTVTVTEAANTAPTADDQSVSTDQDTSVLITLTGDDVDGDSLTFTIESLPADGVLYDGDSVDAGALIAASDTLTGDQVTYVPDGGFSGDDSFTFSVSDGTLDSAPATVDITVASGNEAPMAVDDTATVDENSADNTIDVLANDTDVDGDTLTVSHVTQPANGTVTIATDSLSVTYTPDADFFGTDTFTYDVSDGTLIDTATVTVTVTEAATGSATIEMTPDSGIGASSFDATAFQVTNTGDTTIDSVVIDLSTTFFPDIRFDPLGEAGDVTAKCVEPDNSSDEVGFDDSGDLCVDPFSGGSASDGYTTLTLSFDGFDPGEQFVFAVDVDPTTIKGFDSAGNAGAISGLEMAGATTDVTFSDGTSTSQTFGDGSEGGAAATVPSPVGESVSLSVDGVTTADGGFSNGAQVATVEASAQSVVISGTDGTAVTLIVVDAVLEDEPDGGYNDLDDYERNKAVSVTYLTGTISGGSVSLPVEVSTTEGEVTYLIAAATSGGVAGPVTAPMYLELADEVEPPPSDDVLYRVNAGGPELTAIDDGPDWSLDTEASPSQFVNASEAGFPSDQNQTYSTADGNSTGDTIDMTDPSIPPGTPEDVFKTERYDPTGDPEMSWSFPVSPGNYTVRLYFAEIWTPAADGTEIREFDVTIEGALVLDDYNVVAEAGEGGKGIVESFTVASDGTLDILFAHVQENPAIKGIEILAVGETVTEEADAGDTVTTDGENDGATADDPVETSVTTPNAGTVTLTEGATTTAAPSGYSLFGQQVDITAPAATSTDPLVIIFELHSSLLPSSGDVEVFKDGILVAGCDEAAGAGEADPDPCVDVSVLDGDGNLLITVLTSEASSWNVGVAVASTLTADPASVDFGDVTVNSTSAAETLTFTNEGATTIEISDVAISGDDATLFSHNFSGPVAVAAGESTTIDVVFEPASTGGKAAILSVSHDGDNSPVDVALSGNGVDTPSSGDVLYRVNPGGPQLAALDGGLEWSVDTNTTPSPYRVAGGENTNGFPVNSVDGTVPSTTPTEVFTTERWDPEAGEEMQWEFPVASGTLVEVRLYMMNGFDGTDQEGQRVFDVILEGDVVLDDFDLIAEAGDQVGTMRSFQVTSDGIIDLDFARVVENPLINAIEILVSGPQTDMLGASPTSIDFGSVEIGLTADEVVTLTNLGETGDPDITVGDVTVGGTDFTASLAGAATVSPGESTTIDVVFEPTSTGPQSETLSITHSGSNTPIEISLSGEGFEPGSAPVGFSSAPLALSGDGDLNNPTSLQFGPDDRLYVSQQNGIIKAYTLERTGIADYTVLDVEVIDLIQDIPNHDDDGSLNAGVGTRQVTGILVTGTSTSPVLYVTSSDPRIGAGGGGTDLNLDTNSGVLSRLTWNGTSWEHTQLVRGLPRSEENHSSNGIQIDEANNTLYIAQGGHTNKGAKSNNFAFLPEYALSAAILSVDLGAIGNGTYDLPTLAGTAEPFGGDDGANQALLVEGGPVQIYSPGWRNPYDIVITEAGHMYTVDNGPNGGWGGVPTNEGPDGTCTDVEAGEDTTEADNLHFLSGPGYYGGHPNVTRGNPDGTDFPGAVPSSMVNPVECDYREPLTEDGALTTFGSSTNGLAEYTASNFGGAMQGDLLTASFSGDIWRIQPTADGASMAAPKEALFSNFGNTPLDVTALGDDGVFPGTVWAATYGSDDIVVFEPDDFDGGGGGDDCTGADDASLDEDGDGYDNADEIDNGTDPCNASSVPADQDGDGTSDLNDPDDDNDGRPDVDDAFALDPDNGTSTSLPVLYEFVIGDAEGTIPDGLGFTGLMVNGTDTWADMYDPDNMTAGGAADVLTVDAVPDGDAYQANNDQLYGFQFGVDAASVGEPFTVHTQVLQPFGGEVPTNFQSVGLFIGNGDQDNYVKLVVSAQGGDGGIQFLSEVAGSATELAHPTVEGVVGAGFVDLWLHVDPVAGTVNASYAVDGGEVATLLTEAATIPTAWVDGSTNTGMAAGLISTSFNASPFTASWDFIRIEADGSAEPTCTGADDESLDEDGDGYSNADELDNGTDPCDAESTPPDFDGDGTSDLNDPDDDNDGLSDTTDTFALDADNGTSTTLPVALPFEANSQPGTLLELGFTGLMTNGTANYAVLFDPENITIADGQLTVDLVPAGDAHAGTNTQQNGFQLGFEVPTEPFTVHSQVVDLFPDGFTPENYQSAGFYIGTGDQDNYLKLVASANAGAGGVEMLQEVTGTASAVAHPTVEGVKGSGKVIDLYLSVDPVTLEVTGSYAINGAAPVIVGTTTVPAAWLDGSAALAIGIISTSNGPGPEFPATWELLEASVDAVEEPTGVVEYRINAGGDEIVATDGGPNWAADTEGSPSEFVNWETSGNETYSTTDTITLDPSVPSGTPMSIFQTERYDVDTTSTADDDEMQWSLPASSGVEYEVRLYFAEIFIDGTNTTRTFDVFVEGNQIADDLNQFDQYGHDVGFMISHTVVLADDFVTIDLVRVLENPAIKGIEIVRLP